jgi:hypothetical protein
MYQCRPAPPLLSEGTVASIRNWRSHVTREKVDMIMESVADQGLQTGPRVPAATLHDPPGQHARGMVYGDRDAADHSRRPSPPAPLDTGSVPSAGQRGQAAPRATGSSLRDLREEPPESVRGAVSEDPVPLKSILGFEDRMGLYVRRNGLVLPDGMSFDLWHELGSRVALIVNCSAWWLGDWLVYGEQAYSDRYKQAIADTSLGYQTLRNYAWIARKFPMSRRRDKLSFGHHVEVAALPDDGQDVWLARAERLNWSRSQLRRGLRAAKLVSPRLSGDEGSIDVKALKIDVPAERHDRWKSAAKQKNSSMADWIIATLDRAASEELSTETTPVQFHCDREQ